MRRENRIRTIHSSLAIEHNSLSLEQVTAILDGKRVLGNPNEIKEVQNAYDAYELMLQLDPASVEDLLRAHRLMMNGLVSENGRFRSGGEGTLSAAELMERLGLSHRPTFRKNYLNPALEQNLIVRTIPDKPNSRNQKYRKTER